MASASRTASIHPESQIDDKPIRYGSYAPENFDITFQGTVTVRKALQLSLNVPAVAVLDSVRASRLTTRLAQAGDAARAAQGRAAGPRHGARRRRREAHGPHRALCRRRAARHHGAAHRARRRASATRRRRARLLDPVAAWYVANVLIGTPPPANAPAGRIAFKTGTSYGYRDAWSVGFDGKATIGVWVGRPDGAPVPGLVGRTAAAPILFDAFARIGRPLAALPPAPKGAIFATTARLPPTAATLPARRAAGPGRAAGAHPVSPGRHAARAGRRRDRPARSGRPEGRRAGSSR